MPLLHWYYPGIIILIMGAMLAYMGEFDRLHRPNKTMVCAFVFGLIGFMYLVFGFIARILP